MSTTQIIIKKVALLPEEVQMQILDYVTYLALKYEVEEDEALLKAFLAKRVQQADEGKLVAWNDVKADVFKKYK